MTPSELCISFNNNAIADRNLSKGIACTVEGAPCVVVEVNEFITEHRHQQHDRRGEVSKNGIDGHPDARGDLARFDSSIATSCRQFDCSIEDT
ncbi:MAG: hypothetical protein NVSMB60_15940 [Mycobacterium sp.]